MQLPEIGEGVAFGIGKTNYRVAICDEEGIRGESNIISTPETPDVFFKQTVEDLLSAADEGARWAVMGVPGPVKVESHANGVVTQNFRVTQIPALSRDAGFDPIDSMILADPAADELFRSNDFTFLTVNDGDLAAQAAAHFFADDEGEPVYDVVADLIDGSGTGGAVVRRDKRFPGAKLFHPDPGLWEVGHHPISPIFPSRTIEKTISGPAIEKLTEKPNEELDPNDPIFKEVAQGLGSVIINDFTLNAGADLVVISGGFAVNTQENYWYDLECILEDFRKSPNPMSDKLPDIEYVKSEACDDYELYGARGAMLSFVTRQAIDQLVMKS